MTHYDFVVTRQERTSQGLILTAEKVAVLDDDTTLNDVLAQLGVSDATIGNTIERLEGIPYHSDSVMITRTEGNIVIKQP